MVSLEHDALLARDLDGRVGELGHRLVKVQTGVGVSLKSARWGL